MEGSQGGGGVILGRVWSDPREGVEGSQGGGGVIPGRGWNDPREAHLIFTSIHGTKSWLSVRTPSNASVYTRT